MDDRRVSVRRLQKEASQQAKKRVNTGAVHPVSQPVFQNPDMAAFVIPDKITEEAFAALTMPLQHEPIVDEHVLVWCRLAENAVQMTKDLKGILIRHYPSQTATLLDHVLAAFLTVQPHFVDSVLSTLFVCLQSARTNYNKRFAPFSALIALFSPARGSTAIGSSVRSVCLELLRCAASITLACSEKDRPIRSAFLLDCLIAADASVRELYVRDALRADAEAARVVLTAVTDGERTRYRQSGRELLAAVVLGVAQTLGEFGSGWAPHVRAYFAELSPTRTLPLAQYVLSPGCSHRALDSLLEIMGVAESSDMDASSGGGSGGWFRRHMLSALLDALSLGSQRAAGVLRRILRDAPRLLIGSNSGGGSGSGGGRNVVVGGAGVDTIAELSAEAKLALGLRAFLAEVARHGQRAADIVTDTLTELWSAGTDSTEWMCALCVARSNRIQPLLQRVLQVRLAPLTDTTDSAPGAAACVQLLSALLAAVVSDRTPLSVWIESETENSDHSALPDDALFVELQRIAKHSAQAASAITAAAERALALCTVDISSTPPRGETGLRRMLQLLHALTEHDAVSVAALAGSQTVARFVLSCATPPLRTQAYALQLLGSLAASNSARFDSAFGVVDGRLPASLVSILVSALFGTDVPAVSAAALATVRALAVRSAAAARQLVFATLAHVETLTAPPVQLMAAAATSADAVAAVLAAAAVTPAVSAARSVCASVFDALRDVRPDVVAEATSLDA